MKKKKQTRAIRVTIWEWACPYCSTARLKTILRHAPEGYLQCGCGRAWNLDGKPKEDKA